MREKHPIINTETVCGGKRVNQEEEYAGKWLTRGGAQMSGGRRGVTTSGTILLLPLSNKNVHSKLLIIYPFSIAANGREKFPKQFEGDR